VSAIDAGSSEPFAAMIVGEMGLAATGIAPTGGFVDAGNQAVLATMRQGVDDVQAGPEVARALASTGARLPSAVLSRMESALDDERTTTEVQWNSDNAAYLLLASAGGMPLTNREARLVHEQYRLTLDRYASFAPWDLWADDLADGTYGYLPGRPGEPWVVGIEEIAFPLLACAAPMSAASPAWIDCDVVNDPERWGE